MKLSRFSVAVAAMFALVAAEAFAQVGSVLGKLVDEKGNSRRWRRVHRRAYRRGRPPHEDEVEG